jgi:biotin carboxylase
VRTLVTTSRMPFAVDEIRKLGESGNDVTAVDTFKASPGSHSRGAARHVEVPAPKQQTDEFIDAIVGIMVDQKIEWLLPMFEEVFYLAAHRDRLEGSCQLFFPDFPTLAKVHDKVTFSALCRELGLPVAESITATSTAELRDAIGRFDHWFARAAYGRGGLNILTNAGPLAGEGSVDEVQPSPEDPWLVQEYLQGIDMCSWSVVHDGEIALHSTYEHALEIDNRGGIVFSSVDAPETLAAAQKIVGSLGWTGQVSFDFLRTDDGVHHLVECNPRPTDGCTLASAEEFDAALFGARPEAPVVVPAGRKREIKEAVLRDMFQHLDHFRSDAKAAKGGSDVYGAPHDHLPLLYTVLSLQHVKAYRKALGIDRKTREDLTAAQFFDVSWDGEPIT